MSTDSLRGAISGFSAVRGGTSATLIPQFFQICQAVTGSSAISRFRLSASPQAEIRNSRAAAPWSQNTARYSADTYRHSDKQKYVCRYTDKSISFHKNVKKIGQIEILSNFGM
jgi:hypothetical protein